MPQRIAHVTLVVRDYDEAIRYFTEVLGFELLEDTAQPEQNKRWVVVRPGGGAGVSLLLAQASDEAQATAVGRQTGGRVGFFLETDNFSRDFERYKQRGVHFVRAPAQMPYGTVAVFEDLYGNRWDLIEYAGASADAETGPELEAKSDPEPGPEPGNDRDAWPRDPGARRLADAAVDDAALHALAVTPTKQLDDVAAPAFQERLSDAQFMRVAALLAEKSHREGGCPIGAVIVDNETRRIVGKGHNTLVQDSDPYNHGETAAMRDAGRIDFSRTTLFTSLSPCDVCTALIIARGFPRVVVGDVTNASGNEATLRERGVDVDVLEDAGAVALYGRYRAERPELDLEDWLGKRALRPDFDRGPNHD